MCPCGKKKLDENLRKSCLDDIPSCGEVCDKILNCGPVGNNHHCKEICHEGPCPKCPLTTEVINYILFVNKGKTNIEIIDNLNFDVNFYFIYDDLFIIKTIPIVNPRKNPNLQSFYLCKFHIY